MFLWVVAQMEERRTVTAANEGSTPFDPPNKAYFGNCGREVRHLVVNQTITPDPWKPIQKLGDHSSGGNTVLDCLSTLVTPFLIVGWSECL